MYDGLHCRVTASAVSKSFVPSQDLGQRCLGLGLCACTPPAQCMFGEDSGGHGARSVRALVVYIICGAALWLLTLGFPSSGKEYQVENVLGRKLRTAR